MPIHRRTGEFSHSNLVFRVDEYGTGDEAIVLLHGFPSNAQSWAPVAERLAANGYRVLALEQRGYASDAQPRGVSHYIIDKLVDDVAALLDWAHLAQAHIVGHDWGGVVAWVFASKYPERTRSLTAVSTPHPAAFREALWTSKQLLMSWYVFFFQLPFLPEHILTRQGGEYLMGKLVTSGLSRKKAAGYTEYILKGRTLTSALNWYRALLLGFSSARKVGAIHTKALFVYGGRDHYLSLNAARLTQKWVNGAYKFVYLPRATHWIPEESPELLASQINTFLKGSE